LRELLVRAGRIVHEHLFFTDSGRPIPEVKFPYTRWQRALRRLAIRYRKPYMARHTSVSWNLMIGRNPLLVAKGHGHRITTMLSVYAAWTEGAVEADIAAIRDEMNRADGVRSKSARDRPETEVASPTPVNLGAAGPAGRLTRSRAKSGPVSDDHPRERRFGSRFGSNLVTGRAKLLKTGEKYGGKGGTRTLDRGTMSCRSDSEGARSEARCQTPAP
jgi:hypothetical protein